MEFPEILKLYSSLYTKEPINFIPEHTFQTNIMFVKWIIREPELVKDIRHLIPYLFFISSKHFFYLLYTHVPKRVVAPKIRKKPPKIKKKADKILDKIQEVLGWSNSEIDKNIDIIEKTLLKDKKHWKKEFGLR